MTKINLSYTFDVYGRNCIGEKRIYAGRRVRLSHKGIFVKCLGVWLFSDWGNRQWNSVSAVFVCQCGSTTIAIALLKHDVDIGPGCNLHAHLKNFERDGMCDNSKYLDKLYEQVDECEIGMGQWFEKLPILEMDNILKPKGAVHAWTANVR